MTEDGKRTMVPKDPTKLVSCTKCGIFYYPQDYKQCPNCNGVKNSKVDKVFVEQVKKMVGENKDIELALSK
jgi:hypothetical protein